MPVLFPGMNPYLEHPDLWPEVHQRFIKALADLLQQQLPAQYEVAIRKRIYRVSAEDELVVGQPDSLRQPVIQRHQAEGAARNGSSVAIRSQPIPVYVPVPQDVREDYLEIFDPVAGEVITVIEVLTPKKKRAGRGREIYEQHRETILGSPAHFVEIDLLRGWEPLSVYGPDGDSDYRILVSRREQRPKAELYAWLVSDPIPLFSLPLLRSQEGLIIDLKQALDKAYDRSGYDLVINYTEAPLPPLRREETHWLEKFLQQLGLRE
ncbi:MAG: DUF4058 family protein [Cyanobacteria bacterium J06554_6]